ncbi:hypothetical protein BDF14DRAFT_1704176, partial [Spinellus fusiger]
CNLTVKRPTPQPLAINHPNTIEKLYFWVHRWVRNSDTDFLHICIFLDEARFDVNSYYMKFINIILDEMDKILEMNNFYIFMGNTPTHTAKEIEE